MTILSWVAMRGLPDNMTGEGLKNMREKTLSVQRRPLQPRGQVPRLETGLCTCLRNGEKARVEGGAELWSWKSWVAPRVLVRPLASVLVEVGSHGREESHA